MSIKAMSWAWDQDLEPTTKLVLLKLADNLNDHTGQLNPSISLLAKQCCVSRRTAERHLSRLRDLGLISWENVVGNSGKSSNVYTIRQFDVSGCDNSDASDATPVTHTHATPVTHPLTSIKPEPLIETQCRFEAFWMCYPRKQGKPNAIKAFKKINPDDVLLGEILVDLKARVDQGEWDLNNKQYIPHASTYLNGQKWLDEIVPRGDAPVDPNRNAKNIIESFNGRDEQWMLQ